MSLKSMLARGTVVVEVDTSGTVDVAAERRRLEKDLAAAQKELAQTAGKLGNEAFLAKAPEDVVAKIKARQQLATEEVDRINTRLAGLPSSVVERARDVLAKLEDADRKNPASQLIDDLPLFQVAVRREEVQRNAAPSKVEDLVKGLNPDDMTPREAMDALYALKKELGNR